MRNFININDNQELSGQVIGAIKEEIEDVYNLSWEICKLSKFKQKLCIIVHQKMLFVPSLPQKVFTNKKIYIQDEKFH